MKLHFDTTFTRKITLITTAYLVEQNAYKQTITITHKHTGNVLYKYKAYEDDLFFRDDKVELIKEIFKQAHIQRYIL